MTQPGILRVCRRRSEELAVVVLVLAGGSQFTIDELVSSWIGFLVKKKKKSYIIIIAVIVVVVVVVVVFFSPFFFLSITQMETPVLCTKAAAHCRSSRPVSKNFVTIALSDRVVCLFFLLVLCCCCSR